MTLLQSLVPTFSRAGRISDPTAGPVKEARVKPAFALTEDDHVFEVVVQLPGVARDGLEITALEGELTVIGRRAWSPPPEWTTIYRETPRANFELTLTCGTEIDRDKIGAELKNGLLRLTLPKAEAAKPRKIAVS